MKRILALFLAIVMLISTPMELLASEVTSVPQQMEVITDVETTADSYVIMSMKEIDEYGNENVIVETLETKPEENPVHYMQNEFIASYQSQGITSGTLGDNNGFKWTYDTETMTLTVSGEDSGLGAGYAFISPFYAIDPQMKKIIFKDCVFLGSLDSLCNGLTNLSEVVFDNCDTSNVTNMDTMFYGCTNLTALDLSNLDTSNVTSMTLMFRQCKSLKSLNLRGFDTSNITEMNNMFEFCSSLTYLNISTFDTSNVTTMSSMFYGCESLTNLDVSSFDTSNVVAMDEMFACCDSLTSLNISNFDTSKVTTMKGMFLSCKGLKTLDVSTLDTSNVTTMESMFFGCSGLTSLDISRFNTSNVESMYTMFSNCSGLTELNLGSIDTSSLTNMNCMFTFCTNLKSLDLSGLNTSNVTSMWGVFSNNPYLQTLKLSGFDTSSVVDMSSMFNECESLVDLDLSGFDTSNVNDMSHMFDQCKSLLSLNLSNFDTSNVENMEFMFQDCTNLQSVNVSSFDTSKVISFAYMFSICSSLINVDVRNFNTSNATYFEGMFWQCTSLKNIDISNFSFKENANYGSLLSWCESLSGEIHFPKGITRIPDEMYYCCRSLTGDLVIPEGVETIGEKAFRYLNRMSGIVYLPDSVTSIGANAFDGNSVIICNKGSYAEEYAKANGYRCGSLDETYTITYHLNGGENSVENPNSYTFLSDDMDLNSPTREGYYFDGWYTDSEFKTRCSKIYKYSSGNLELYAKWEPINYRITYYVGNGTHENSESYTIEEEIILKDATRDGYAFKGWFTDSECRNQIAKIEKGSTGYITLYAKWEALDYTITYHLNGGTNNENNPSTYNADSGTISLKTPTRLGYTFDNWYENADFTKRIISISPSRKENVEVYAKWLPVKYTIIFDGNGADSGFMNALNNMEYEATYTLPANNFKKNNATFAGWNTKADGTGTPYKDQAEVLNLGKNSYEMVTLYAQWKVPTYKITYKLNNGKNHKSNPSSYKKTDANITLKNPSRTGYQFAGWYSDSKYKNKVTKIDTSKAKNITLYAKWSANSYTIKFDKNNGSGSMSSVSAKYDVAKKLPDNKFTRKGYKFNGWDTSKDGKGTSIKNKAEVSNLTSKNKGEVKLYAQWKTNTYTLTFESNGGKTADGKAIEPIKYKVTTDTFSLPKPVKKGYTFGGWFTDKDCKKTKMTKVEEGSTGSKTLYAKWIANKYIVTFSSNTGKRVGKVSGSTKNQSLTYAKSTALTKNGYKINGYTFKGWATTPDGTVKYKDGEKVKNLSSKSNGKVTLYAVWSPKSYTITYKDGGTHENPAKYNIESKTITLKKPTKNGYTFVGWYKDSKFTKKVTKIASGTTGNQTLYAKWTANKYKIKFDPNEASLKCTSKVTGTMSKKSMTYSKSAKLTKNVYKASGYTFTGWATTPNGKVKYKNEAEVKNLTSKKDGTVTLYAVWKLKDTSKKPVAKYHNYKWVTDGETRTMTCSGCGKTGVTEYKCGELWGYYDDAAAVELMSHVNEQRKITTYTVQEQGVTIAIENVKPLIVDEKLIEKAKQRALAVATKFNHAGEQHECLAWGQGSSLEVFSAWYHSESHRWAMLDETYVTGGTACFYYDSDNSGTNLTPIWVLELGF